MSLIPTLAIALGMLNMAAGNLELRPAGWLDKLVHYHREKLLNDVRKEAPIQIKVSLEPCPEGYVDSPDWNETSVVRLLTLLQQSKGTKDVRRALRRAMGPSRRFMSAGESWKHFPSLAKGHPSYFYYPDYSEEKVVEKFEDYIEKDEERVLQISNPVESRLPSAQISVRLLKKILEARAMAARVLPTTKRTTMEWKTKSTTPTTAKADDDASSDGAVTDGGADNGGDATTPDDASPTPDDASPTSEGESTIPADDSVATETTEKVEDASDVVKLKAVITTKPTTEPPTTTPVPTTEKSAPTTEKPAQTTETPASTTEARTTEAPTTEASTTEAPTTTTEAPTTEAPTTTTAPTTEAPTTAAPTSKRRGKQEHLNEQF